MDLVNRDSALLGAGYRFFGDKQDIAFLHERGGVFVGHFNNIVLISNNMGFDTEPTVFHAVNGDCFVLFGVDYIADPLIFFIWHLRIPPYLQNRRFLMALFWKFSLKIIQQFAATVNGGFALLFPA